MRKLLSILLISFILFGCSKKRILLDELTNKGTGESPIMYNEDGLFNGIGFDVFTNGQLRHEGRLVDGKLNGLYKCYYESGQLKEEGNWKENGLNGLWKYYYENGQLKCEGSLEDGKINGLWKYYHENGQLKQEGSYRIYNHLGGVYNYNLSHNIIFSSSNDKEVVEEKLICFLPTINPYYNRKSHKYGLWKYYYENGQLIAEGNRKGSDRDGLWKYYYENGQLKAEGNWKGSNRDGLWKYYDKNGQLEKEWHWEDGKKGCKYYYENGQLKKEGVMTKYYNTGGDSFWPSGWWKFYYPNGQLQKEGEFYYMNGGISYDIPDKKRGVWKYYYENGQLKEEIPHSDYADSREDEKKLGTYKSYYENGQLKEEGEYGDDYKKNGLWKFYYPNGRLKEEGNYASTTLWRSRGGKGEKHLTWWYYYENGELEDVRNYRYGKLITTTMAVTSLPSGRQDMSGPKPQGNQVAGKVVVIITVDGSGNVINAIAGAKGSTTLNKQLLQRAKTAALKTKFEPGWWGFESNEADTDEEGKIIYHFIPN